MKMKNNVLYSLEAELKLSRNCIIDKHKKMKKTFLVLAFALLCSTSSFAKCGSINLGFVTIITGEEWVSDWQWIDNGETFVQVDMGGMQPCSSGNRWQWFWE
jgi:hypothetical protein